MTTSDSFNRADGAIGTADTGEVWSVLSGTWTIASNQAKEGTTTSTQHLAVLDCGVSDGAVQVTIPSVAAGSANAGLSFRASDVSNHWRLISDSSGTYIEKKVAGTFTTMASYAPVATDGDVLRVVMLGSLVGAYRNGTPLGCVTDSFNSTATKHGLDHGASTSDTGPRPRWDDFSVGPTSDIPCGGWTVGSISF